MLSRSGVKKGLLPITASKKEISSNIRLYCKVTCATLVQKGLVAIVVDIPNSNSA